MPWLLWDAESCSPDHSVSDVCQNSLIHSSQHGLPSAIEKNIHNQAMGLNLIKQW